MHHHKTYMCINFQQNRVETQVVTVLKLKANINLAFKNSKNIDIQLQCIASHPLLKLHNNCMACCCHYSMHQMRLHITCVAHVRRK